MIVFDLKCGSGHVFEAWFGSSAAYEEQQAGGLVECPLCGSREVGKAVMAPNVAAKGNARAPDPVQAPASEPSPEMVKAAMAAIAQVQAKMLENSEWVGVAFTDRARAMHNGDARRRCHWHLKTRLEQGWRPRPDSNRRPSD